MQRFILEQNIERFRSRLAESQDEADRERLKIMLAAAQRELALLQTAILGVRDRHTPTGGPKAASRQAVLGQFLAEIAPQQKPSILIDPEPGLAIVEANAAYETVSGLTRQQLIGQPLFLLFPDNPDDATADGVSHLYASLRRAAESGRADAMPIQRYDVRGPDGRFVQRYWRPMNTPLSDGYGRLIFLLHQVEEVTEAVLSGRLPA